MKKQNYNNMVLLGAGFALIALTYLAFIPKTPVEISKAIIWMDTENEMFKTTFEYRNNTNTPQTITIITTYPGNANDYLNQKNYTLQAKQTITDSTYVGAAWVYPTKKGQACKELIWNNETIEKKCLSFEYQ